MLRRISKNFYYSVDGKEFETEYDRIRYEEKNGLCECCHKEEYKNLSESLIYCDICNRGVFKNKSNKIKENLPKLKTIENRVICSYHCFERINHDCGCRQLKEIKENNYHKNFKITLIYQEESDDYKYMVEGKEIYIEDGICYLDECKFKE